MFKRTKKKKTNVKHFQTILTLYGLYIKVTGNHWQIAKNHNLKLSFYINTLSTTFFMI